MNKYVHKWCVVVGYSLSSDWEYRYVIVIMFLKLMNDNAYNMDGY